VLTKREQEVLRHVAAGLTTQESARVLLVSPKTVDNHKQRIFNKLDVQSQAHAVAVAYRIGILSAQPIEDVG
jgi:DNA-binding CsgD family transcriptional regulator